MGEWIDFIKRNNGQHNANSSQYEQENFCKNRDCSLKKIYKKNGVNKLIKKMSKPRLIFKLHFFFF